MFTWPNFLQDIPRLLQYACKNNLQSKPRENLIRPKHQFLFRYWVQNFAQITAVILPCSLQNCQIMWHLITTIEKCRPKLSFLSKTNLIIFLVIYIWHYHKPLRFDGYSGLMLRVQCTRIWFKIKNCARLHIAKCYMRTHGILKSSPGWIYLVDYSSYQSHFQSKKKVFKSYRIDPWNNVSSFVSHLFKSFLNPILKETGKWIHHVDKFCIFK